MPGLKIGQLFYGDRIFCKLLITVPNEQEIWPTTMYSGRPNAEIGQKMANG